MNVCVHLQCGNIQFCLLLYLGISILRVLTRFLFVHSKKCPTTTVTLASDSISVIADKLKHFLDAYTLRPLNSVFTIVEYLCVL